MIQLVAFLGNYGREYEKTRHNAAWQFADSLPFGEMLDWQSKFKGIYADAEIQSLAETLCNKGVIASKDGSPDRIPEN